MKLFASFTATLREMKNGTVTEQDLETGLFVFGCSPSHAHRPWKDEPNELTWFWKDSPEDGLNTHTILVNALLDAEMDGRAIWLDIKGGGASYDQRDAFIRTAAVAGAEIIR